MSESRAEFTATRGVNHRRRVIREQPQCGDITLRTCRWWHDYAAGQLQVNEALTLPGGGVWEVGPGQVTDDSEMALCLLRGLEQGAPPALPEEAIATGYADWYNSGPFDIGARCQAPR